MGSFAFAVMAYGIGVTGVLFSGMELSHTLIFLAALAVLTALTEALSSDGIDNLTIPVVAYVFLNMVY